MRRVSTWASPSCDLLGEQLAAGLEALGLGPEVEAGLLELGQRLAGAAALALEILLPLERGAELVGDPGQAALAVLAAAGQGLALGLGGGDLGAGLGQHAAGLVEPRLGVGQGLAGLGGQGLAARDLVVALPDQRDQLGQLGLLAGELGRRGGALVGQVLDLGGRRGGAAVEVVGLAGLPADLALGQADAEQDQPNQ